MKTTVFKSSFAAGLNMDNPQVYDAMSLSRWDTTLAASMINTYRVPYNLCGILDAYIKGTWTSCRDSTTNFLYNKQGERLKHMPVGYSERSYGIYNTIRHTVEIQHNLALNVARWFWYIEGHMNWWDRTKVHYTNIYNIVFFEFSGGWWQCYTSISLLTLMVRLAPYCQEGISINDVLSKIDYSRTTKHAIWRFLDGYQHYTGGKTGWYSSFRNATNEQLPNLLVHNDEVAQIAAAYWEKSGKPQGRDQEFWKAACRDINIKYSR